MRTVATSRGGAALVGGLDAAGGAYVDAAGGLDAPGAALALDWWVGADDGWHVAAETSPRQRRAGAAPVVETRVRVPGGDAVHRVYGIAGSGGAVVVEVENDSPAPFVVAFVARPRAVGRSAELALDGAELTVGGRAALSFERAPSRWAIGERGGGVLEQVVEGRANDGPMPPTRSRHPVEAAVLAPVAHRASVRVVLATTAGSAPCAPAAAPDAGAVARGWDALLERGMRTDLPEPLQSAVDAARATLLLAGAPARRPQSLLVAALEDWGFDAEAALAWAALGSRARRRAARRAPSPATAWVRVKTYLAAATDAWTFPGGPSPFLAAVRDLLVVEAGDSLALLPGFPRDWLGADVAVHGAPTRLGPVSFALRWHGARPALLWEAPAGASVGVPALDRSFSSRDERGEVLLGEPRTGLVDLGEPSPRAPGDATPAPGSFT
jgi:hypothetical protein